MWKILNRDQDDRIRMNIKPIIRKYDPRSITVAVLGSHSALDVCRGAKDEGFKTLVICEKGRSETYSKYYISKDGVGCVDEVIELEKFKDVLNPDIQQRLISKNSVFVPHRSFEVYLNNYDAIENDFKVPMFGNRNLLRAEERSAKPNQYDLMRSAGIHFPQIFENPKDIDRLVIVKVLQKGKEVGFERGFFFASSYEEYKKEAEKRIKSGFISEENLANGVIEEFVVGVAINFNFFYSQISDRLELMGTDTRRQTNLDGFLRLPGPQQSEALKHVELTFKEMGHIAATIPESLIDEAMDVGERFVDECQRSYSPGVIGPFGLQSLIRPVFPKLEIVVYDVAPRMPGSPGTFSTPYSGYLFGQNISVGRRVAKELKQAIVQGKLEKVLT